MEPIVSPWIIYLISTVSKMHDMLAVSFGILVVACFLGLISYTSSCFDEDGELLNFKKKHGKKSLLQSLSMYCFSSLFQEKKQ